ncbi:hypothetical protein [Pseudoalteromonas sp. SG44-8]|uniref:hypothetical protein n=1 Tax=Pseudoalteromonas sp. SG44-8 TaxID=2760958 RepID=UPI001604396E|nr:hypothetical protein [Pseudoalteromonas sp. SG44-8]MBB1399003.1 hypothetical protein [Pseudoalteromonas sp. SG44-8]
MKRAIAFIVIVPISAFLLYEFVIYKESNVTHSVPTSDVQLSTIAPKLGAKTSPDISLPRILAKPKVAVNQTHDEFDAINRLSEKAEQILKASGFLPTDLHNEVYIEFDLVALRKLKQGDNFDLAIPQTAETFSAEVTNVIAASNGDKSIFGRVLGADGRFHTTVMTIGADAIYGQLTAPSGNYVFEGKGQYGWLATKRDLYKNHMEHQVTNQPTLEPSNGEDPFAPKAEGNNL